jgi:hypothetical protein
MSLTFPVPAGKHKYFVVAVVLAENKLKSTVTDGQYEVNDTAMATETQVPPCYTLTLIPLTWRIW